MSEDGGAKKYLDGFALVKCGCEPLTRDECQGLLVKVGRDRENDARALDTTLLVDDRLDEGCAAGTGPRGRAGRGHGKGG